MNGNDDVPDRRPFSIDSLWYHSGWPGHQVTEPPAPGIPPYFRLSRNLSYVTLLTEKFRPNHLVTIRNEHDGWEQDVFGAYLTDGQGKGGQWVFGLDPKRYPPKLKLRFVLDRAREMIGEDLPVALAAGTATSFSDHDVTFPAIRAAKFLHPYDNLITTKTKIQQDAIPGNVDESIVYDVIIVGSGMGGAPLADALSDVYRKRVLVLEAGSLLFHTHLDNMPGYEDNLGAAWQHQVQHYINRPDSHLMFGVQMSFGGRSVYWEGLIPRMHDWELEYWPESIGTHLSGPNGYARAERLLRKCRTLGTYQDWLVRRLRTRFPLLNAIDLPRSVHQPNLRRRASSSRWSVTQVRQTSTGIFSAADLLLDSLAVNAPVGNEFLTVNLNHLVTGIETVGDEAQAVVCQDLIGGVERKYRGKTIVLAAGSLESPRIALASALSDPNNKIGVGLTDHPAFFGVRGYTLPPFTTFSGARHHAKVLLWHKSGADHPYNIELLVNPQYWMARHADDDVYQLFTNTGVTWVAIKFTMDSPLDDSNRIHYMGAAQKLEVEVRSNDSAFHLLNECADVRNQLLEFLGADYDPKDGLDYAGHGTVHHAGGSLRMSSDHSGVVDENLKFECYRNLYCCDVSVFPHIPTANPSLTLVALSQRLADHIGATCSS